MRVLVAAGNEFGLNALMGSDPGVRYSRRSMGAEDIVVVSRALPVPAGLTAAAEDVARLAASGLTNEQIAERRGVAPRTVANQLSKVYAKLGAARRRGLVARLGTRR